MAETNPGFQPQENHQIELFDPYEIETEKRVEKLRRIVSKISLDSLREIESLDPERIVDAIRPDGVEGLLRFTGELQSKSEVNGNGEMAQLELFVEEESHQPHPAMESPNGLSERFHRGLRALSILPADRLDKIYLELSKEDVKAIFHLTELIKNKFSK